MKAVILLLFLLFATRNFVRSQENGTAQFGNVTLSDFEPVKSSVVDNNTNGIVLFDIGRTKFILNKRWWFSYIYTRHIRIKIINNKAFDLATLRIGLYGLDENKDELSDLKAKVYNLENGKIITTTVEKKDVIKDKRSPFFTEAKLAMPSVKEGSIIEFIYTTTSYRYYYIPTWHFQYIDYPCLYSEYSITIPDLITYGIVRYGFDTLHNEKNELVKNNKYYVDELSIITNDQKRTWIMKDVPGFSEKNFINSPRNYLDKIAFNLVRVYNGEKINTMGSSWESVTEGLLGTSYFGAAIDKGSSGNLLNAAEKITSDDKSPLEIAKHLYSYVQDNFTCLPDNDIFLSDDLYNINKKKNGTVADLNMLLIGLLRQKGILADPVILSTQEYGINLGDYPVIEKMNYVICMVRLAGDTLYLDASRPGIGFGHLPLNCYNGYARIISNQGAAVYFNPETIKEQRTTTVFIVNESKGKSGGWVERDPGFFGTEQVRMDIKESGLKKYFEKIRSEFTNDAEMLNAGIDSLDKPDFPVKVHFDFNFPLQGDVLYFNPIVLTGLKQNPFKPDKRKYPVSFSMPVNEQYTLNMEIPEGYIIDELPKPAKVSFNENEGFFEYLIQANQQSIQLRSRISLPKVYYPSENYQTLRDFYTFIVAKYSEQVVFKKKK